MSFGGSGEVTYGFGLLQSLNTLGLPTNLGLLNETEHMELKRQVIHLVEEMYAVAVQYLGEECARDIWQQVARGKHGRPTGTANAKLDELLLDTYDRLVSGRDAKGIKSAPREVAKVMKRKFSKLFQATAPSVERHLRRLLKNRDRDRAAKADADRKLTAEMIAALIAANLRTTACPSD
jgi:hypothetical protein